MNFMNYLEPDSEQRRFADSLDAELNRMDMGFTNLLLGFGAKSSDIRKYDR